MKPRFSAILFITLLSTLIFPSSAVANDSVQRAASVITVYNGIAKAIEKYSSKSENLATGTTIRVLECSLLYPIGFKSIGATGSEPQHLIKEIVELRGLLRRHSLSNPGRWNSNKQELYVVEAVFLGSVCLKVAFPKTTQTIWKAPYLEQFQEQAKKGNFEVELAISVTMRIGDKADEHHFNMKVPQMGLDERQVRSFDDFDRIDPSCNLGCHEVECTIRH